MKTLFESPFGIEIFSDDVIATMQHFSGWEDRYRQVIQWGKLLPKMPEHLKDDQVVVSGCESQVWLVSELQQDKWWFGIDSDARIVRGLIALVLAAYQGKTASEITEFDFEEYFELLGLSAHLTPSRGNGLRSIVEQIKVQATA